MDSASENKKGGSWKLRFGALGLGVLAAGVVFGIALAVSEDLRLLYLSAAILLFCFAIWIGANRAGDWLCAVLLFLPLGGLFAVEVLPQARFLWLNLLFWAIAAILGLLAPRSPNKIRVVGFLFLLGISAWYCIFYIPKQMKQAANRFGNSAAPAFVLQPISQGAVPVTATPGKVLVIDFFGTWCPPCIAELPVLERVRSDLQEKGRRDIEFVVAATNAGGDTPERVRAFGQLRHVTLPLAFDAGGKAHTAFGLSGFPGIVVIDREGRVRLTRQGYNTSETSFRTDLTQLLESM